MLIIILKRNVLTKMNLYLKINNINLIKEFKLF